MGSHTTIIVQIVDMQLNGEINRTWRILKFQRMTEGIKTMSARKIAKMIVEALKNERECYLDWLQTEDYGQIEDELTEYLTAE